MKWLHDGRLLVGLLLLLHISVLLVTQFTAWPEMLIYPYLLNHGFSFYGDIIQPYMPTLPFVLFFVFKGLGFSVFTLQLFTWIFVLALDVSLYVLASRYFSRKISLLVLFTFIVLQTYLEGNGLWFDLAATLFVVWGFYFFGAYLNKKRLRDVCISSFFIGIAFITKQTAFWYLFLLVGYGLLVKKQFKETALSIVSFMFPLSVVFILFGPRDILYWAFTVPFVHMSKFPGYVLYPTVKQLIVFGIVIFPMLVGILTSGKERKWIWLWGIASLGFVLPRFAYFHLQPALPFVALSAGVWFVSKKKFSQKIYIIWFLVLGILWCDWFIKNVQKPIRFFEPEVYETAATLRTKIGNQTPVFFYNDMGNIMFVGEFIPPRPWAYNFPWYMELPELQEKMTQGIQKEGVQHVVAVPFGTEGQFVPGSYKPLLLDEFISQNFTVREHISPSLLLLGR